MCYWVGTSLNKAAWKVGSPVNWYKAQRYGMFYAASTQKSKIKQTSVFLQWYSAANYCQKPILGMPGRWQMLRKNSQKMFFSIIGHHFCATKFSCICLKAIKFLVTSCHFKVHCLIGMIAYSPKLINFKA